MCSFHLSLLLITVLFSSPKLNPFPFAPLRVENHHDQNPLRVLRYVEAFKGSDKEDGQEQLSEKQPSVSAIESGTIARASLAPPTPSLSRTTSHSSSHRGWEILRRNTLGHVNLGLDLDEGDGEDNIYHL